MRPVKLFILLTITVLFSLACMVGDLLRTVPTNTPTQIAAITPLPTPTPSSTPLSSASTAVLIPAWITDFANPILVSLSGRRPDFQDEFTLLNRGWFYFVPASRIEPYYAHLIDGALILKLPEGTEKKDSMVFNPKLIYKNFVLSLDFKFGKTEPDDTLRFQFDQTADQSVTLDLSKNQSWNFNWSLHNNWQSSTGIYDYFSPELINVVIIMRGDECAVYLNHDPLDYLSNCRSGPIVRPSPLAVTFHLLGTSGQNASVTIDNVKLWDLDKIPGLP